MVLRTVNAVCGKRKSVKTIIFGDTTNLTVDINWFIKKYNSEDLKDKDYKWVNPLQNVTIQQAFVGFLYP